MNNLTFRKFITVFLAIYKIFLEGKVKFQYSLGHYYPDLPIYYHFREVNRYLEYSN